MPKKRTPPFRASRIYLLPAEVLHPRGACSTCAQVQARIQMDKAGRRMIPEAVLEAPHVLSHLEQEVLGRPMDFGDPAKVAAIPLENWYGGGGQ